MKRSAADDALFMEALELAVQLPSDARCSVLLAAYAGETSLVRKAIDGAARQEEMGDFLLDPLIPPDLADARFAPGECVSDRFLIIREVGEGGMGVVYEAVDSKLDQRCALKCAKPGFALRLPPEARSALRITHDNVCRVYGLYTAEGSRGPVDVLAMEYLDGETLSERLARNGPLDPRQALEVALQLCAGLSSAHRQGVLHRDLKSNNVMLVPAPAGGLRAVITDFGVATRQLDDADLSAAGVSDLVGASAYIAPELWRGERASVASDVYALGIILCEMMTGHVPSAGNPALPLAPGRLTSFNRQWDICARQCLSERPADRPASVAAIATLLTRRSTPGRAWVMALLVAIATTAAFRTHDSEPVPSIRLALLPFETNDEQMNVITSGVLPDLSALIRGLDGVEGTLRIIPASAVAANRVTRAEQAETALGATHVLSGTVERVNDRLLLNASLVDARTLITLRTLSGKYGLEEAGNIPVALAGTITAALHLNGAPGDAGISQAAYPAFSRGMSYLRATHSDPDLAIRYLHDAAGLDAQSALPHAALTEAFAAKYQSTGDSEWLDRARQSLEKAESRNPDLALVRIAAGRVHLTSGRHQTAADDFRRATQLEPDNVIAWLGLARAYEAQRSRPGDAAAAFQRAVELQPEYYLPHLQFGSFYHFLGNYTRAAEHLERAIDLAPDLPTPYSNLGGLYADMGRYPDAARVLQRSLELKESYGALTNLGAVLNYQGRDHDALVLYRRALRLRPADFVLTVNIGDTCRRLGLTAEAGDAYRQGLALADRAVLNDPGNGYTRAFVAYFAARLGQHDVARRELDQARRFSPYDGKVIRRAVLTYEALGQRHDALTILRDAPRAVLQELSRQPDLGDLQRDSAFQRLLWPTTTEKGERPL
jgi:serine/threonine protein kinase/tetratricopeptide (TPR) repeat protein